MQENENQNVLVTYTTAEKNTYELLMSPVSMYAGLYHIQNTVAEYSDTICTHLSVEPDEHSREQQELVVYALHLLLKDNRDILSIRLVNTLPEIQEIDESIAPVYKPGSMSSFKLVDIVDSIAIYKWDNGRDDKFTAWYTKSFDDRIEVDDKDLLIRAIKHEKFMNANRKDV